LEILPPIYYSQSTASDVALAPVGSGPYQFVERSDQDRLVLKAVPGYWAGPPTIDTLIFQPITDASQRVTELATGQAHLVTDLTPEQATTWDSTVGQLKAIESTKRIFIGLRTEEGTPLADKRVRQALNYAVNVQAIVDSLLGGYGQRYGNWVNSADAASDLAPWPFDIAKARELLAEAGYAQGFELTLDTPVGRYHQDEAVAQAIAEQLGQVGIKVEVRSQQWPTYVEDYLLARQMAPLFLLGLNSRGNKWEDTNNLSFSFPFNLTNWHNAEFERLLKEAKGTFNERQRQTLLSQAQAIAYEETPWIWLWREYSFYGVNNDLGWQPRPDGLVYLYQSASSTEP
jgi:peptide/nickel transport system substrate-binding protein